MTKPKFWGTLAFKRLQEKWYKKLEKDGFKDEERILGNGMDLKQFAGSAHRRLSPHERQARALYFQLLSHHIAREALFDDHVDRFVMEKHAEGIKQIEIAAMLKKMRERCHKKTVMYIVRKYENRWGIKKWRQDQLKSRVMPRIPSQHFPGKIKKDSQNS